MGEKRLHNRTRGLGKTSGVGVAAFADGLDDYGCTNGAVGRARKNAEQMTTCSAKRYRARHGKSSKYTGPMGKLEKKANVRRRVISFTTQSTSCTFHGHIFATSQVGGRSGAPSQRLVSGTRALNPIKMSMDRQLSPISTTIATLEADNRKG